MKTTSPKSILASILLSAALFFTCAFYLTGCANTTSSINKINSSPTTAIVLSDLEAAGRILAIADPKYANVAAAAVDGLTAIGNNPTAVTGSNIAADTALIVNTISAIDSSNTGLAVAGKVAQVYSTQMAIPGVSQTPVVANAALANISKSLYAGIATVPAAN